jgi:hypothetical protein
MRKTMGVSRLGMLREESIPQSSSWRSKHAETHSRS